METVNQEQVAEQVEQKEEQKTFTQEEVNNIIAERLNRDRAKYADYETLKEKAAKFDAAEEASKTELQKATEKADALEKELASMKKTQELADIRSKVSTETGVPVNLLTAETEEACKAQAEAIKDFAAPKGYPVVRDGGEVSGTSQTTTRNQFAEWFNNQK